jgi:site-specific DNA-methyltransferase (adenine-specific)/adenine-specific DNA-methyltransferase
MPTLNWIGKEAVVNHHHQVPFHLLKDVPELATGDPGSGNLIVQGDNLVALKALLPYYAGQVKCIYIDVPYNTGNEGWIYNDNVNSPLIREWLGKAVGREAEDLSRHDKWLCMMYPRLVLLKQFLRGDGVIFVSIDDNEVASLRLLMDEILGAGNFIANFIWEKRKNRENRKTVSVRHDHVIAFARDANQALSRFHLLPMNTEALDRYKNPDNDERGPWKSDPATAQAGHGTKSQFYVLKAPNGKQHQLPSGRCWVFTEDVMNEAIADKRIWFGESGNNVPRIKTFLHQKERGLTPETILFAKDASTNEEAKNELKEIFGGHALFETPKPVELIVQFLRMCTRNNDLILDSFGGSGTTGHAVVKQNTEDGSNRRFILIEMDEKIARDITAERVRRVAQGYTNAKGEKVEGLGGGFRFCELGEPLFDEHGQIKPTVRFADLARHVYFTETGGPLPDPVAADVRRLHSKPDSKESQSLLTSAATKPWTPLIGICRGVGIYLLFNGILGDKSANGGNILTRGVLAQLPKFDGQKVIYCAGCLLGKDRLQAERITIRQTPYEIKVS